MPQRENDSRRGMIESMVADLLNDPRYDSKRMLQDILLLLREEHERGDYKRGDTERRLQIPQSRLIEFQEQLTRQADFLDRAQEAGPSMGLHWHLSSANIVEIPVPFHCPDSMAWTNPDLSFNRRITYDYPNQSPAPQFRLPERAGCAVCHFEPKMVA